MNQLVMMCTYSIGSQKGIPSTSTTSDRRIDRHYHDNLQIWQAARATSAAPTFFKPIHINKTAYVDGGLGYNNPAFEVFDEAEDLFPNMRSPDGSACLVNIGTGETKVVTAYNWKRSPFQHVIPTQTIEALKSIVTDCDSTHEQLTRMFRRTPHRYFRFNVKQGLENVGLGGWKKVDYVIQTTERYLREHPTVW